MIVLSCLCYAKLVQQFDKLKSRTKTTMFLVFSEVQTGYVLYDLTTHSFIVSRDVVFKESKFPFKAYPDTTILLFLESELYLNICFKLTQTILSLCRILRLIHYMVHLLINLIIKT